MSSKMSSSRRAGSIGGNRGGCGGGGYERLDPDFDIKRAARMRAEYDELDEHWKQVYLEGLNKADKFMILNRDPK